MADPRQNSGEPIRTISAGQGAVVADRANASQVADAARRNRRRRQKTPTPSRREPEFQTDRRLFIGLAVAALTVVAIIFFLASRAVHSVLDADGGAGEGERTERVELDLSNSSEQSIAYDGYLYAVQEVGGSFALTRTAADGGEPLVLADLAGSPVALVLYDGAFIIGENLGSGWDVVAYTMSDGSMASALIGTDGEPVAGEGLLVSMGLEGDELVLSLENGQSLRTPLR